MLFIFIQLDSIIIWIWIYLNVTSSLLFELDYYRDAIKVNTIKDNKIKVNTIKDDEMKVNTTKDDEMKVKKWIESKNLKNES